MKKEKNSNRRIKNEIKHFSEMEHIWWGAQTLAGQRRYDFKFREFKKYCKPKKDFKILEIGCGDGEFTKRLRKLKCRITASDVTRSVVEKAKNKIKGKNMRFVVDNAERMKLPGDFFDIVVGISILHHLDYPKALKEILRVLKDGGQLFFTEPNLINPMIFAGLNIKFLRKRMEFSPDETALIRWKVERVLKKTGFKKFKVLNYDFLYPQTPPNLVNRLKHLSAYLEKVPLIKEISGSLIIWAKK